MPLLTPADQLAHFRQQHTKLLSEADHLRLLTVILNLRDRTEHYTLPESPVTSIVNVLNGKRVG